MKKLFMLLVLLSASVYSQNATLHFFYGTNNTLGGETMFKLRGSESVWLGGGFSATTNELGKIDGDLEHGEINSYDMKYKVESKDAIWASIYAVGSYDVVDYIIVKYKLGLGVYNTFTTFDDRNATGSHHSYDKVYSKFEGTAYKPLIGIGALCPITKEVGVEVGVDTFNYFTVGFTVLF
jgi:hypothetical protein